MLLGGRGTNIDAKRLCDVCAELTGTRGAAITLMSGGRDDRQTSTWTTSNASATIEHLQSTLGEGPSVDAYEQRRPVVEPNLLHPSSYRWPVFRPKAVEAGARSVFAFPLQTGTECLGVLTLHSGRPRRLAADHYANATMTAQIVAQTVLALQTGASPETLAPELEVVNDFEAAVHQATGMVSAQLGVRPVQALVRLRNYALGTNRLLVEVANDVVARKLRFNAPFGDPVRVL